MNPLNTDAQPYSPDRRELLKGMVAVALAGGGLLNTASGSAATIGARAASAAIDRSQGLTWLPVWQLREMIAKREVSSVEVVQHFLDRIEEHNSKLNALRKLDVQGAREQAARADKIVKERGPLGPLHGVPIAVKESFSVKGFSFREESTIITRDDIEVERLRAAGAIIVGTTVAAGGLFPGISVAQLPRNPWNSSHTTGSSSAGNGAAVAGGLLPMAIGDDGGGSTRYPSAFCGLMGLHPTRGRIPHVDYKSVAPRPTVTIGPMTRNVRDAAIALQVLAGPDGRDFVCLQDSPPDFLAALDSGIKGKRFAWTDGFGFAKVYSSQVVSAVETAAHALQRAGASLSKTTMIWESPVTAWLAAQQLMGFVPPGVSELSDAEIVAAFGNRQRNWQRFRQAFNEYDFIVSPTATLTAPKMDAWVELWEQPLSSPDSSWSHLAMCNILGLPAISVPAGFVDHMPVGLHVIGKPGNDAELLQVAQAFLTARNDA